jgi:hypothetical protein
MVQAQSLEGCHVLVLGPLVQPKPIPRFTVLKHRQALPNASQPTYAWSYFAQQKKPLESVFPSGFEWQSSVVCALAAWGASVAQIIATGER